MRCIVFTNDKGGVGKTTTVANLAVGLAMKGLKTLVVDMDPQADVTYTLLTERPPGISGGYIPPTAHALFLGHYSLKQVILQVPRYSNLSLIPANSDLADASLRLALHPTRLKRLLLDLPQDTYQVILIDTGKGLDPLAINAMAAADDVIIMVSPGKQEIGAIARKQEHVRLVRDEVVLKSEEPRVKGILLTMADPYSVTRDTWMRIHQQYPGLLLSTIIPKNNDLQKAIGRALNVFETAPESNSAQAYQKLIQELGL